MSRVGKKILQVPSSVTVESRDGKVLVKGPKGALSVDLHKDVSVAVTPEGVVTSVKGADDKFGRSIWGTFGSIINNMIKGVVSGFEKKLEISGIGFKAAVKGKELELFVGYTHPVIFKIPEGIEISVEKNIISVKGIDKQLVGEVAASIRRIKKPEPYQGKGIKYVDEVIRRKAGKAGAKTAAA